MLITAIFKMIVKTLHKIWAVKIQHCPISSKFDMLVDNDVPNWFPTLKNFYRSPFSKWPPQYHTNLTLSDFNAISYVGRLWCPELIPDIEKFLPVAIFKIYFLSRLSMAGLGDFIIIRLLSYLVNVFVQIKYCLLSVVYCDNASQIQKKTKSQNETVKC
jgi:hypothetical protein